MFPNAAILFIVGLSVGSFLNAYIFRLRQGQSVWRGRSYCPQCKKPLAWYELIPLLSFILQSGRCCGCRQKIDWQYPVVELGTGILFVLAFRSFIDGSQQISNFQYSISNFGIWNLFGNWELVIGNLIAWYLLSVLVILFVYDLRFGLVPDRVVLPAIVVAFLYHAFSNSRELENDLLLTTYYLLLATAVGAAFFAAQYYLSRGRWLGAGDIRIGALMGAMLGWPLIFAGIAVSYFIGGFVGILLLFSGKKKFGQTLPLGTFLTLGTAIVFLYGQQIWNWYWR